MLEGQEGVTWARLARRRARRPSASGFEGLFTLRPLLQRARAAATAAPPTPGRCSPALAARDLDDPPGHARLPRHVPRARRAGEGGDHRRPRSAAAASSSGWAPGGGRRSTARTASRSRRSPSGSSGSRSSSRSSTAPHRGRVHVRGQALSARGRAVPPEGRPAAAPADHPRRRRSGRGCSGSSARWADEFNTVGGTPDEVARAHRARARRLDAAGRDQSSLTTSLMTWCFVGRTEERRSRRIERARATRDAAPARSTTYLATLESDCIVGTPDAGGRAPARVRGGRRAAHHAEPRALRRPRDARGACHGVFPRCRIGEPTPRARRARGRRALDEELTDARARALDADGGGRHRWVGSVRGTRLRVLRDPGVRGRSGCGSGQLVDAIKVADDSMYRAGTEAGLGPRARVPRR